MTILCTIDLLTREVALPFGKRIASYDHNVDAIRFQVEAIPGFSLDTSTIKIAAQGPNKARHDYAVDPSTVAIEEETGYITFDWPIPAGVTEMPLDVFKYGDKGQLIFAVCAEIIDGSTVSKAWHSDDGIITVVAHLEPESGGGEDPEETATNAQKIAQLQTATAILQREVSGIASGTPPTASSTSEMDPDESTVYINTTDGKWYYYDGSAWTSGGTYGGAVTDTTLSISGRPADAKAVGDALATKADTDDVDALDDRVTALESGGGSVSDYFIISNNLFNKDDADIVLNSEIAATGTISEKSNYFVSGFIPVEYGKTYTLSYPSNIYGTNSRVITYNANKERIGYRNASERATESPYWITFTADAQSASYPNTDVAYVRYTGYAPYIDSYRFVEGTEYSEYMPYGVKQLASEVDITTDNIRDDFKVSAENTTFIGVASKNLLDVDAMVVGDLSNQAANANVLPQNTGYLTTDFIPVEGGKTYALYAPVFHYGVNNYRGVPCYNTNKEFVGYVLPNQTLAAGPPLPCTVTIPTDTAYIRNCYPKTQNNWKQKYYFVITESDTIPDGTYIPYQADTKLTGAGIEDEYAKVYNPLIGKLAVWDGDSICAADDDSLGGWPMRIASDNHMRVKSYAVSGATITSNTSASHWISAAIDTIAEAYPNADYVIIDGGTNDADQLRNVEGGIGTFDADDFSAEYIAALDKDTFSGALEYVFYKMVTVWKGKHLGYIIPQKMGTGSAAVAGRILFFDRARAIAAKWGIPVLDLWNNYYFNWKLTAHYNPDLTSDGNNNAGNLYRDGQHLTDTGYAIQSPVIAEWMKGI